MPSPEPALSPDLTLTAQPISMIDLPVVAIWLRALASPFVNIVQLLQFGFVSTTLSIAIVVIEALILFAGMFIRIAAFWHLLALTIVFVPFDVGWTRLAINGPAAVAKRPYFAFARTEAGYLGATLVFELVWLALFVPIILLRFGQRNFDRHLIIEATFLLFLIFAGIIVGLIRSLFIFPAIALGRYQGVAAAWRQSKGAFERLIALEVLAHAPYLLVLDLLDRLILPYSPILLIALVRGLQCVVYLFSEATNVTAIALAWRHASSSAASATVDGI